MGLLDDAIREHLELKRKHGADPDDVARQEQEALGPGRRNEFAQPEGESAPEPDEEPPAAIAADELDEADEADELPGGEPDTEEAPPAAVAAGDEDDPWLDEDRDEVPSDEALQPPPTGEQDVLEETPEFLQETPEHDRLWFEQKAPKDFDFDK